MNPFLKVLTFCAVGILGVALVHAITPNLAGDSTTVLQAPAQPVPASLFAMNYLSNRVPYHPTSTTVVPWPTVPFDGVRIWHALWLDLEPQKGKWDFDHLDAVVNAALQNNSEVMLLLAYTPQWASSNPDPKSDWKPGSSGPLRDMNDWRTYVRTVATRYKGKIHVYEIWNEPDRPEDWTGGVDAMVQMVKEASIILKQVDPSITVVSPSATNPNGLAWLSEFLQRGGGQSVDVIGYHFYVGKPAPPEDRIERIQKVQALMRQYGVGDKPLWNTETGWI